MSEPWDEPDRPAPESRIASPAGEPAPPYFDDDAAPPRDWTPVLLGGLALLLALLWIGVIGYAAIAPGGADLATLAGWVGLATGPLSLLALLYILFAGTGRREARRYARTSRALRTDSQNLAAMLALLSRRMAEARALLGDEGARLVAIGDDSAARLARAGEALRQDGEALARHAAGLDDATSVARTDIGVLIADLPDAEARTRTLAATLGAASDDVRAQLGALTAALAALATQSREADSHAERATGRLTESLAALERTGGELDRTVEQALAGAARAVEETRRGVAGQGAAMTAMVEQGRATLERAGTDAGQALARRLEEVDQRFDGLAERLGDQERTTRALLDRLGEALGQVEARFAALGANGAERTADLAEAIVALAGHADQLGRTLGSGADQAQRMIERVVGLRQGIDATTRALDIEIPAALQRLRLKAERALEAIGTAAPQAEALAQAATTAEERLGAADDRVRRQAETMAALVAQAGEVERLVAETGRHTSDLADGAGPRLVESLVRVRETAAQASAHAEEALARAIPNAAARLGEASAEAIDEALRRVGEPQAAAIAEVAGRAVEAARAASDQLMRQMLTIADSSATIEARIAQVRTETEQHDEANFARAAALLIEGLNSSAIDMTRVLASDVGDAQWSAYLKGDRGVFTRQAVQLLSRREAREIAALHRNDDGFRERVNRYVHDFEGLLRRVLASRDGAPLGVTMLSSDMGKLYVVLAQAIERLRR